MHTVTQDDLINNSLITTNTYLLNRNYFDYFCATDYSCLHLKCDLNWFYIEKPNGS